MSMRRSGVWLFLFPLVMHSVSSAAHARDGLARSGTRPAYDLPGRDGPPALCLANAVLDTSAPDCGQAIPARYRAGDESAYAIVQFNDRITPSKRRRLEDLGAEVIHFVPRNALAVRMPRTAHDEVAAMNDVLHVEPYHAWFKMHRDLIAWTAGSADEAAVERVNQGRFLVLFFPGVDGRKALADLKIDVVERLPFRGSELLRIRCEAAVLDALVSVDDVQWIEPDLRCVPLNDRAARTVNACALTQNDPDLDGSGVIVAITDTGVDVTHRGFAEDPAWPTDGTNNTRIVHYEARAGVTCDGVPGDAQGHGTHTAGTVLGNGALSETAVLVPGSGPAPYGANQFAGIAPGARLVVLEDFNSIADSEQAETAYRHGARIVNNGWGTPTYTYGASSMIWDALVRDADFAEPGDQALIAFFAAGNSGNGDTNGLGGTAGTVCSPGNAKNVITVGAIEQLRLADNYPEAAGWTDSPWQVAPFSSRGPVHSVDPRIKPDLVAPGTYVLSAQSRDRHLDADSDPSRFEYDLLTNNVNTATNYAFLCGTSLACASASGCGALIYQYVSETFGKAPSPALMKAALIQGCRPLNPSAYPHPALGGAPPVVYQGWGMVDVVRALKGLPGACLPILLDQDDTNPLQTGDDWSFAVDVAATTELKVALVWTDEPASPSVGPALVNDLDLIVHGPGGETWLGNYFNTNGLTSALIPGGSNPPSGDGVNNAEVVLVSWPAPGIYTVEVSARSVPIGPQDYALAIGGAFGGDQDGDGLDFAAEQIEGTDPCNPDSDGDGMIDGWEVTYELNPHVDDTSGDPDEDGFPNGDEYGAGTHPRDSSSLLRLARPHVLGADDLVLQWSSVEGKHYSVNRSMSGGDSYAPLQCGIPAAPPVNAFTDTVSGVNVGLYRLGVE